MEHAITMSTQQLIYLTEIVGLNYAHLITGQHVRILFNIEPTLEREYIISWQVETMREMIRAVLRTPLKDPRFKRQLEEHFAQHPHDGIRVIGWPWIAEQLVWEVEL